MVQLDRLKLFRSTTLGDQKDSSVTTSAAELVVSALDREKWLAEKAFRDRELVLKEREQARLEDELRLKREDARRSRWSSPLVIAIAAAAAAALGNAGVAWQSAKDQRTLENDRAIAAQKVQASTNQSQLDLGAFKAEAARLFEVVKTNNPDKAAVNLQFLLDVGLVTNTDIKTGLSKYLKNRKEGEGFVLPTFAAGFNRASLLLDRVLHLTPDQALKVAKLMEPYLSTRGSVLQQILKNRDPKKKHLQEGAIAKEFLQQWVVEDDRDNASQKQWSDALDTAGVE